MSTLAYQQAEVAALGRLFKLLAEPNRLRILLSLGVDCRPVAAIVAATGLSQTNCSFHLRLLREAGVVRAEPRPPFVFYCLHDPTLLAIVEELRQWLGGCGDAGNGPSRSGKA
ncbi:MAG: transcriptional regulator [Nitrospirae bacterium CG18_big_fil_WC_8_21_14_2_50_70_55]|nr:winged helix-turn-helix transcriptional regulator [Deltaproteobacteria bacterium]OIP62015.1 MAG: hypothetical protein AUK30_10900 [Nitrospirae bacterium CG2_30_70_394]PIQ06869.1 MAG: transcriptional regulator [Nitrospirae bacterium CG18_big_fil_WC_8_21_14_2_50_70_55]PIU79248.1 MAG: ArsR family transcriptional regulator [Nitrospirae bacterium CG06_land_8_20_14_3_00_70_43]PIW83454.1 MAG: ArsR family transcriptional regulator [Nitrospirae bacterium CG_4_8_14_3_um_filter_70_85]PIX83177.1 MAG: A